MIRRYRPPRLPVGKGQHFLIRLGDELLNTVVFLSIEEEISPGVRARVPRASAFLVMVDEGQTTHIYVVTARHCIEETAGRPFFIRANFAGTTDDRPTSINDWFCHDHADVAVSPFVPSGVGHSVTAWKVEQFIAADYTADPFALAGVPAQGSPVSVMTGDEVVFISLFVQTPGKKMNLPVARFGHIARMPLEPITFARTGGTEVEILGYLAESHSWGGHSGAPVLWHFMTYRARQVKTPSGDMTMQEPHGVLGLLGLVSGHFDIEQAIKTEGDVLGKVTAELNAGMAVVTPAEAIRELLMREDVVADRKERGEQAARSKPKATFDSGFPPVEEATAFERFEELARKLINTPKPPPKDKS